MTQCTLAVLEAGEHDLFLAYHGEYDDTLHATSPFDQRAIQAARKHIAAFVELAQAAVRGWQRYNRTLLWAPDHGVHTDPVTGREDHGEDSAEDMEVVHFYGFYKSKAYDSGSFLR